MYYVVHMTFGGHIRDTREQLRAGDLVVKFNKRNVSDPPRLFKLVNTATPEGAVELTIVRAGKVLTRSVVVGEGELEAATVPADAKPGSLDEEIIELRTGVPGEELTLLAVRGRVKAPRSDGR